MFPDYSHFKRAALAFIVLAITPAPLSADELKLTPGLSVQEEYNDNIFLVSGNKQSDFITTLTPSLEFSSRTEQHAASISGGVNWLSYVRYTEFDSVDFFGHGAFSYQRDPQLAFSVGADYIKNSQGQIGAVTGLAINSGSDIQSYQASGSYAVTEKSQVSLGYTYSQEDFDNPSYLSTREHRATAGLGYTLVPGTTLEEAFSFDRQLTDISQVDNYSATISLKRKFKELWSLYLNAGGRYTRSVFSETGVPDSTNTNWGFVGGLAFNYSGEKMSSSVSFNHNVVLAPGFAGSTQMTGGSATLGNQFTREFFGNVGFGYFLNKSTQGQFSVQPVDETTLALNCLLRYDLTYVLKLNAKNKLALEANYNFTNIEYNYNGTHASQNVIMLRLLMRHMLFL